jgi:hypothetical protein
MSAYYQLVGRPAASADPRSSSVYRTAGLAVAVAGLMAVLAASIADFALVHESAASGQETLAWSFGLNFAGFNVIKIGIAVILMGIIVGLWMRVDSVKEALPYLKATAADGDSPPTASEIETPYGRAEVSTTTPKPRWFHTMAEAAWTPMLLMGPMVVAAGLALAIVQSTKTIGSSTFGDLGAATAGAQFLGEALTLAGISFILGTVLSSLRKGGGEVQESAVGTVKTLKTPLAVWAFIGLMAVGLMAAMADFALFLVTTGSGNYASWQAWLGPLGLFSLGALLSGIVLALYTIGTVLGFQFDRIREIVRTGR